MSSYNKVILMGNLTRDPQMKYLGTGTSVAEFGVAVNRKWKDPQGNPKEEVAFVDCTAFGKTGELIGQHFTKGKLIFFDGRLKFDSWEDKNGGGKRSKLTVIVENFQFVGGRDGADGGGGGGGGGSPFGGEQRQQPQRAPQPSRQPVGAGVGGGGKPRTPPQEPPFGEEQQFTDADIPFLWTGRVGQPA